MSKLVTRITVKQINNINIGMCIIVGENYMLCRNFNIEKEKSAKQGILLLKIILEVCYMVGGKKKNIAATILGKVALNSAKAAADSRCMYCLHQPKQPTGMKKLSR